MRTQKAIKLKNGILLPAGLPAKFTLGDYNTCVVQDSVTPYRVRITSAFKMPGLKTMEKWSNDGIAKSVLGKRVEPDGWDSENSPSWMLVAGVI